MSTIGFASNSGHSVIKHNERPPKSGIQDCDFSTFSRNVPRRRVRRFKEANLTRQEVKVDLKANLFIGHRLCSVLGSALLVDPGPGKPLIVKYSGPAKGSAG